MVQVLPYVPGFGEKFAAVLGSTAAKVGEGYQQKLAREQFHKLLNPQANQEQITGNPMQQMEQAGAQSAQGGSPTGLRGIELIRAAEKAYGPDTAKYVAQHVGNLEKAQLKEEAKVREEERGLLQPANKAFYEKLQLERDSLPEKELAVDSLANAIETGQTGVWSSANLGSFFTNLGAPEELRKALETPGSKEFKSASKTVLATNMRDTFRGNTTGREISIAEQIGPEIGIDENANKAAVAFQQVKNEISKERIRLVGELQESGIPASRIPAIVDKRLDSFIKEVKDEYFTYVQSLGFTGKNGKTK